MGNSHNLRTKHNGGVEEPIINAVSPLKDDSNEFDSLDFTNIPINNVREWRYDAQVVPEFIVDSSSEERISGSSEVSISPTVSKQASFEDAIQQCFGNLNCLSSLDPKFAWDIEKFNNKRTKVDDLSNSIYVGMFDIDAEQLEVPEDFGEDCI